VASPNLPYTSESLVPFRQQPVMCDLTFPTKAEVLSFTSLVCLWYFIFLSSGLGFSPASERPPNFIVIVADDLGYGDLGVYGHPIIRTPNLDRMASEGVRLTNFYAAASICTPSRAALLTGRYPIRSGLIRVLHPREEFGIPDYEITLAEALKARGYSTACIGKWHLGDLSVYYPNRHGFDFFFGLLYSNDMTIMPPNFSRLRLYRNQTPIEWPVVQRTLTQRYTAESIRFIEENKDRPFFLYLPHTMPHTPLSASKEFRGRSQAGPYGDVAEEIDWSTGQILKTLRDFGLDDETLVVFTSDNGPALSLGSRFQGGSPGPLRGGKHTVWEGGLRVPCIVRWPGHLPAGVIEKGIATLMDFFPTLIESAGGTIQSDRLIDGYNILPMLQGKRSSPYSAFYYFSGANILAVRSGPWKLHLAQREPGSSHVDWPGGRPAAELYNLEEDPSERNDVARSHPKIVARLKTQTEVFRSRIQPGMLIPPWRWLTSAFQIKGRIAPNNGYNKP
jgi:arylsulfatase A